MSRRISPFSDGSDEDNEYWNEIVKHRREIISEDKAVEKILSYLNQSADVLEIEKRRYREAKDVERHDETKKKLDWIEGVIIWINHNV